MMTGEEVKKLYDAVVAVMSGKHSLRQYMRKGWFVESLDAGPSERAVSNFFLGMRMVRSWHAPPYCGWNFQAVVAAPLNFSVARIKLDIISISHQKL